MSQGLRGRSRVAREVPGRSPCRSKRTLIVAESPRARPVAPCAAMPPPRNDRRHVRPGRSIARVPCRPRLPGSSTRAPAVSLKFKDEWLERRFQDTYFDENIQYIRIATFLGAVTWAAFGPLALLVVDDEGVVLDSVIRYGLGVPTGLVSLALTYLPNYRRIWQPMITAAILFSGLVWVIHRAFVVDARARLGLRGQHADPDLRVHPQPAAVPLLGTRRRRVDLDAQRRRVPVHGRPDDRHRLRRLLPPHHGVHRLGRCVRAGALAASALPA